jgi:predicted TPR repeat methyltransferase
MAAAPSAHPLLDLDAQALLARAYALRSDEESRALYRDWARTYDQTMVDGLQYRSPTVVVDLLRPHLASSQSSVLDIGCGTGLAGRALAAHGFAVIDGLDLSPEMAQVAADSGAYRAFVMADLNAPLPVPDATFDAAMCCGTFTTGHVSAACLPEVLRILRPGAPFAFSVKLSEWDALGFGSTISTLQTRGALRVGSITPDRLYANSPEPDGMMCLVWRV